MVKKFLVSSVLGSVLSGNIALACPAHHDDICVLPRPWGGCAQSACVPQIRIPDPVEEAKKRIRDVAEALMLEGMRSNLVFDYESCKAFILSAGAFGTVVLAVNGDVIGAVVSAAGATAIAEGVCFANFPDKK